MRMIIRMGMAIKKVVWGFVGWIGSLKFGMYGLVWSLIRLVEKNRLVGNE